MHRWISPVFCWLMVLSFVACWAPEEYRPATERDGPIVDAGEDRDDVSDTAIGTESSPPDAGPDAIPPELITDPCASEAEWLGSWDMQFGYVLGRTGRAAELNPNDGLMSRLDLRCAEGTLQAAIHFNYPPVGSWAYELTPTVWTNRIELVGYAVVAFDLSHEIWGADMWRNIVVGLNSGAVNGIFIAAGESSWYRWDTFGARDWVWAGGTMEVDTSPPVIWPSPIERKAGPPDKLLPWDEVSVAMSEPLEEEQIVAGLSLVRADLPDQPSGQLAWQFPVSTSHGVASWPGASWAKTRLSSWTTDAAHEHTTHLLQPVFDPAGNSGSIATQWTIVALPETLLSLDFSTEAALYPWGPVRREMGSVQQGTLCDERDCMIVGPVGYGQGWASPGACIERAGFAARLRTDQAQAIRVTLRLFEAMKSFGSIFSATFHIDVILADGTRIKALLDPTGHWLEPSWEVPPELQPATEWFDIVIPLNAQSDEVAIVVWAGADSKSDCFNYEGDYYAMAIDAVEAVAAVQ